MNPTPRVSVVMAAYNSSRFVRETVDSVLAQTMGDFELVVVDDGSTDDTVAIIGGYDDARIRLYRNGENLGISHTRNRGLELARGVYMAAIDHDDIWLPTKLEAQVEFLDAHPDFILAATAAKRLNEAEISDFYTPIGNPYVLHWALFMRCPLIHASICVRLGPLREHGIRYLQEYHYAEDYELYHRLAKLGKLTCLPARLTVKREHDGKASTVFGDAMNENGRRFLHAAYEALLGEVSEADVAAIWQVATMRRPATSRDELLRAGRLLARSLDAFLTSCRPSPSDVQATRDFAAGAWWSMVSRTAKQHGPSLMRCYREVPTLATRQPPIGDSIRTAVVSGLGPRTTSLLRLTARRALQARGRAPTAPPDVR